MLIKCSACGVTFFLALELAGLPSICSAAHECHATEPHTEVAMDTGTTPKTLITAADSGSTRITPFAGELVMTTDASTVVLS